ncbi:MAG: DUF4271 domain-containing protein [Muribaculaceae bacterium]|nr:DUF4271 domain-containing protein [Muribaculaceae bacterium]
MIQTENISLPADSAVDSAAQAPREVYTPQYPAGFAKLKGNDSVVARTDTLAVMREPSSRDTFAHNNSLLGSSGVMSLLLLVLLAVVVSYRSGYKYVHNMWHNIFSVKMRDFEDHTLDETWILVTLVLNSCVVQGVFLFCAVTRDAALFAHTNPRLFLYVGLLTAVVLLYYLCQLAFYRLLGYVFGTSEQTESVLNGFKAITSLIGLLLLPVVMVMLTFPHITEKMLIVGAVAYLCARIVFIIKGFRIFYYNLLSSVYFILYLCTVEIVPPIIVWVISMNVCSVF